MALTDFGKSSIKLMAESRTELRRVVWPTRGRNNSDIFGSFYFNRCCRFNFMGIRIYIKLADKINFRIRIGNGVVCSSSIFRIRTES